MANEWVLVKDSVTDWKVEVSKHLNKYRQRRTHETKWEHKRYIVCTEHIQCPIKYKVIDSFAAGVSVWQLAGKTHSTERARGMPDDIIAIVEPFIAAELPPKIIRNMLSSKHHIEAERLPTTRQLSNYRTYWLKNCAGAFLLANDDVLRAWCQDNNTVPE
jgi:hypothetical protein